jgi:alpha-L-arabinofuranosidase
MESLIETHRAAIDAFDPQRRLGLVIDEWGTWHLPTPGSTPLWQQSTLRDALAAAITLDAFHRHAEKLAMCNIAQLVNVLQSLILTQCERMVLTPTYHVFNMYQRHQGGQSVRVAFEAAPVKYALGDQRREMPGLIGSASVRSGVLTLSIVNPHASLPVDATIELRGHAAREATVTELRHDDITSHNTFEDPEVLRPETLELEVDEAPWRYSFAPASVTVLQLRP